jgi:hypothetical protein
VAAEDGGDTILRNVGSHKNYKAPHPRDGILHSHRRKNLKSYILRRSGVFMNRVLRRISRPKRDEIIGGWRKRNDEELLRLHFAPNILVVRMVTPRMMEWAEHGEKRNAYRILWESQKDRDH